MGASLALVVFAIGIAGLFYLDRDKSVRSSTALWLPVIWVWIAGSRPISAWMGTGGAESLDSTLEGNSLDASIFIALIVAGIIVLFRRKNRTIACLKSCYPLLIFFIYCLLSVTWSSFPEPAFKRWTKAVGALVMVLIVLTDSSNKAALRRFICRVGFVLLPASVCLIRYTDLGRNYDADGNAMNCGVAIHKNSLGLITFVVVLGALWSIRALYSSNAPNRTRRLFAHGVLVAFGIAVLYMANSVTSTACVALGASLMFTTGLPFIRHRPRAVHALVVTVLLLGGLAMVLGKDETMVRAMGRDTNLTGRLDIWNAVIPLVPNPIVGAGFESFWNTKSNEVAKALSHYYHAEGLNSAHNGYIEVYLNLGWIGVCLLAAILVSGYVRAIETFRLDPDLGGLFLAYIISVAVYSITEAGFRPLTPTWIFLLLAIIGPRSVAFAKVPGASRKSMQRNKALVSQGKAYATIEAVRQVSSDAGRVAPPA